jgi:hypothetical protein
MKHYGTPDPDTTAYDVLMALVDSQDVTSVLHSQRMPIDSRTCQRPGSLLIQAVLNNNTVITVRQDSPGGRATQI